MEYKYKLDYKIISKRIKAARKLANLTQAELAEKIGVSTNAIAKLETNIMTASLQTLINIANVFKIDINYLLLEESEVSKEKTGVDVFFDNVIYNLSQHDKEFIIHIINGLKIYNADKFYRE
jgi:transcriptional regulator with XRE-family HTH domain